MARLKSYHFTCGNSTWGAIGFCARVQAGSKAQAVELLNELLGEQEIDAKRELHLTSAGFLEYATVYFGRVKIGDIDDWKYVEAGDGN